MGLKMKTSPWDFCENSHHVIVCLCYSFNDIICFNDNELHIFLYIKLYEMTLNCVQLSLLYGYTEGMPFPQWLQFCSNICLQIDI